MEWVHFILGFVAGWFGLMTFDYGSQKEFGYMFMAALMMFIVTGVNFL